MPSLPTRCPAAHDVHVCVLEPCDRAAFTATTSCRTTIPRTSSTSSRPPTAHFEWVRPQFRGAVGTPPPFPIRTRDCIAIPARSLLRLTPFRAHALASSSVPSGLGGSGIICLAPAHAFVGWCLGRCARSQRRLLLGACVHARGASVPSRVPLSACMRAVQWLSNGASAGGCAFRRGRCTNVVYSSLSRLLSVVRETLRRHRWLATSRALRPKGARSLDSYVDRPTPTLVCKRKRARVRKLAPAHPPTRPRAPAARVRTHVCVL